MQEMTLWAALLGFIGIFGFLYSATKGRYEATIKQKDATIEYLHQINTPNLSQWDNGKVECVHQEEKRIIFNFKFTCEPAIITNLGNDVGDPISIIVKDVSMDGFTLKTVGVPMRPFATGHKKSAIINWIALSKKIKPYDISKGM